MTPHAKQATTQPVGRHTATVQRCTSCATAAAAVQVQLPEHISMYACFHVALLTDEVVLDLPLAVWSHGGQPQGARHNVHIRRNARKLLGEPLEAGPVVPARAFHTPTVGAYTCVRRASSATGLQQLILGEGLSMLLPGAARFAPSDQGMSHTQFAPVKALADLRAHVAEAERLIHLLLAGFVVGGRGLQE
jgi:hypothetical protein